MGAPFPPPERGWPEPTGPPPPAPPPPPYGSPLPPVYEPAGPSSGGGPGAGGPSGPRAGFWSRLAALLLDGILLTVVSLILQVLLGQAAARGLGLVIAFLYYGFFEGGPSGQTVGKKALDIRVVRSADRALGWGTAVVRHLCSYLSGLPCGLGYWWMLWDNEKQTWHDKLSSTVVVPAAAWPPPPDSFGKPPQG